MKRKKIDWKKVPAGTTHVHVPLYKQVDVTPDPRAFERWVSTSNGSSVLIYEWTGHGWGRVGEYSSKDRIIQLRAKKPTT